MISADGCGRIAAVNSTRGGIRMFWKMGALTVLALALFAAGASAATIKVDVTTDELNDDGDCSLREAVEAARLNDAISGCEKGQGGTKRDTIKLQAADYTNGVSSTNEAQNANGDFDITGGGPVTILGKGSQNTDIDDGTDED